MCSAMNKDQWDPEFLKAIPIMKTRSGMQVGRTFHFHFKNSNIVFHSHRAFFVSVFMCLS